MGDEFDKIKQEKETASTKQIAELEIDIQKEREGRKEDRFLAILITVLIIDLHFFLYMENWGGPVSILILELFLLIVAANRLGVDVIVTWLNKVLNAVTPSKDITK